VFETCFVMLHKIELSMAVQYVTFFNFITISKPNEFITYLREQIIKQTEWISESRDQIRK
jgi:hypothetical protein